MIACVALIGSLVALDQYLKVWAAAALQAGDIALIPNVLILHYTANTGAAFSMLQGRVEILAAISGALVVAGFYMLFFQSRGSRLLRLAFSLMIAGGIGNLIDRAFRGYVIDYLYFKPINFPVFNLADSCVSVGVALLAVYVLFIYREPHRARAAEPAAAEGGEEPGGDAP